MSLLQDLNDALEPESIGGVSIPRAGSVKRDEDGQNPPEPSVPPRDNSPEAIILRVKQALEKDIGEMVVHNSKNSNKLLGFKKVVEDDYKKSLLNLVDVEEVNLLKHYFNKIFKIDTQLNLNECRYIFKTGKYKGKQCTNKPDLGYTRCNTHQIFDENQGRVASDEDEVEQLTTELTTLEILRILDEFIEESDNEPYSKVVETLKTDLITQKISLNEFRKFIKKFMTQVFPIDVFYKKFFKRTPFPSSPDTTTDSDSSSTDSDSSSTDNDSDNSNEGGEERLGRIRSKIQSKIEIIEPQFEKKRGHRRVALVEVPEIPGIKHSGIGDIEPKPIADKIFFQTMADLTKKDCEFLYKKLPWVKDIINHIYIHPIEGDFNGVIDFEKYIEYEGIKYHNPNESYYLVQCHSHKVQEGHVLTVIKNGKTYKMKVAIDTNTKGIVIQNEDMLKAEIDYIRVWNQNKNEYIKELQQNKPNENMVFLAKFELSTALQDAISGNVPIEYRSSNSQFVETVVHTILKNSNSGEYFVRLLANIIIFLKINISFVSSSVFIKRLRELIYLPGTLPFLTDADKLPEIFLSQNVPEDTKNFVLKKLEEERIYFTKNFFEGSYINSSMIRKPVKPTLWNKPTQQIELPDIKTICKNRNDIVKENDEDIVFYTDHGEIYCFNVYNLYTLFQKEEFPVNPYTLRPFSDQFIQIFLTRYASKPLVKKIKHIEHDDLTSKLENLIEQELTMLENNLIETENPTFIAKFKSSIQPPNEPKKRISRAVDQNKCMECKKELPDSDKIRSVFRNKEIFFCGYDCLEKNKAFK